VARMQRSGDSGMTIGLCVATWFQPEWARCVQSWNCPALLIPRMSILPAYQKGLEMLSTDIIGYVHDDVLCEEEGWQERVRAEFEDQWVMLVGFAGGIGHGHERMYEVPFTPASMGRIGFCSNLRDAEVHGERFTGSKEGVILDGLAVFVRRESLLEIGGWPIDTPVSYFMYLEWLCCMARRHGQRIRIVGVACQHLGGRSTGLNPNLNPDFDAEHRYLYTNFRDVLPGRLR
jgi:hypothetical protein